MKQRNRRQAGTDRPAQNTPNPQPGDTSGAMYSQNWAARQQNVMGNPAVVDSLRSSGNLTSGSDEYEEGLCIDNDAALLEAIRTGSYQDAELAISNLAEAQRQTARTNPEILANIPLSFGMDDTLRLYQMLDANIWNNLLTYGMDLILQHADKMHRCLQAVLQATPNSLAELAPFLPDNESIARFGAVYFYPLTDQLALAGFDPNGNLCGTAQPDYDLLVRILDRCAQTERQYVLRGIRESGCWEAMASALGPEHVPLVQNWLDELEDEAGADATQVLQGDSAGSVHAEVQGVEGEENERSAAEGDVQALGEYGGEEGAGIDYYTPLEEPGVQPDDVAGGVGTLAEYQAVLRELYNKIDAQIANEAEYMRSNGVPEEKIARWAFAARNTAKARVRRWDVLKKWAEERNLKKYGDKLGPSYEQLRSGDPAHRISPRTDEEIIEGASRANRGVNRWAGRLRIAGRILIFIDLGISTYKIANAPTKDRPKVFFREATKWAGAVAGGWAGAKIGASAGALIGGWFGGGGAAPGAAIGAFLGGIVGAVSGAFGGAKVGDWIVGELYPVAQTQFEQ